VRDMGKKLHTSGRSMSLAEAEAEKRQRTPTGEALSEADKIYKAHRKGKQ